MKNRISNIRSGMVLAALSLVSLTGCHMEHFNRARLRSTADTHRTQFGSEVEPLQLTAGNAGAGFSSPGYGGGDGGDRVYIDETGHKIPKSYYVIYCDIYWRLNWIRQELRRGRVPEQLGTKLANIRKEIKEATAGIPHDGNYRVADEALTHLETGWKHFQAAELLAAAGAQITSAPWTVGALAMQQYIDSGSMGFGAKSLGNSVAGADFSAVDAPTTGASDGGVTASLSAIQVRAIALAIRYAADYHKAPSECATAEWALAIERTNKLRDQLWLMNKSNNRDSSSIVDVRPGSGTTINATPGEFDQITNTYSKNGTDLPNTSAPLGDPFRMPLPSTGVTPGKAHHTEE